MLIGGLLESPQWLLLASCLLQLLTGEKWKFMHSWVVGLQKPCDFNCNLPSTSTSASSSPSLALVLALVLLLSLSLVLALVPQYEPPGETFTS